MENKNLPPIYELTNQAMTALGLTPTELAKALGVSKSYVSTIHHSRRFMARAFAARLSQLLENKSGPKFTKLKAHLKEHIKLVKPLD